MLFFGKKKREVTQLRDFSLHSGERQTGETLDEIRYDHVARYQLIIDLLNEHLEGRHNLLGLDAFCATGYGSYMLSVQLNSTILGVDASIEAIEHANKFFSNERTFYSNKYFPFNLPEKTFDFVSCIESVEHVRDHEVLIANLAQSVKNGGLFFLSVPNEELLPLAHNPMRFHYKHFHPGEVETIVSNVGGVELLSFYGQNVYVMRDDCMVNPLPDKDMVLRESVNGQFLFYVFRVNY